MILNTKGAHKGKKAIKIKYEEYVHWDRLNLIDKNPRINEKKWNEKKTQQQNQTKQNANVKKQHTHKI